MCTATITTAIFEREGDCFYLKMSVLFTHTKLDTDSSLIFTPILFKDEHQLELPVLMVSGRRRYWSLYWSLLRLGKRVLTDYNIKKIFKAVNYTSVDYRYEMKLQYKDWMTGARIQLIN